MALGFSGFGRRDGTKPRGNGTQTTVAKSVGTVTTSTTDDGEIPFTTAGLQPLRLLMPPPAPPPIFTLSGVLYVFALTFDFLITLSGFRA